MRELNFCGECGKIKKVGLALMLYTDEEMEDPDFCSCPIPEVKIEEDNS